MKYLNAFTHVGLHNQPCVLHVLWITFHQYGDVVNSTGLVTMMLRGLNYAMPVQLQVPRWQ